MPLMMPSFIIISTTHLFFKERETEGRFSLDEKRERKKEEIERRKSEWRKSR